LVRSMCTQIKYIFEYEDMSVPHSYSDACECFFSLVNTHPVVLLIDSIDQMSDSFSERSRISFLEYIDPHPDTRIVVSCLADERDPKTQKWLYCFGCDTRLKESEVPRVQVPGFSGGEGTDCDARYVMGQMLTKESRRLTPNQWTYVMRQVAVEPTALYMRLAVRTVLHWKSMDELNELKETVRGLINQILEHVERDFGSVLTRYALGFITFSVGGIKNNEMEDLLSLDDDVLNDVFQYHTPNVRRLPSHVWLRLLDELSDLLVERDHGCVRWYHRQLQEVAELRYTEHKTLLHSYMAMYFGDAVDINIRNARQISAQPLTKTSTVVWLPNAKINHRRCVEAPYHMIEAKMISQSVKQLCDFNVICALVKSGEGFNIIRYLVQLSDCIEADKQHANLLVQVEHYLRWLCQSMTRIVKSPVDEILTTCTTTQPLESLARCNMYEYVLRGRKKKIRCFTKDSWNRGIALGGKKRFDKVMSVMEGHSGNINCVAWHPREEKIASASEDSLIYIWDATTGSIVTTLQGHEEGVLVVDWRLDGEKIASGSADHTVRIWDAFTGSVETVFTGHNRGRVGAVVWSPEGRFVISGADYKDILVWNPVDGAVLLSFNEHSEGISSIYNGPSKSILSACRGGKIFHWNFSKIKGKVTGTIIKSFDGHTSGVSHACWSPNYAQIASSSLDGTVRLWDTKSGACMFVLQGYHRVVTSVDWSPDGERIAAGYGDYVIRVWHAKEGKLLASLEGHSDYVLTLAWCPESKRLVSGAEDETIRIWNATGIDSPDDEGGVEVDGHCLDVNSVAWKHSSAIHLVSASNDKRVLFWDISSGTVESCFEGHSDKVVCVVWSPDDAQIATASHDTTVRVWDVYTQECKHVYSGHDKVVSGVSWNPCNEVIASGSWDKSMRIWKADTGEDVFLSTAATERVLCVAWDRSGEQCAFGSKDKSIRIVDLSAQVVKVVLDGHSGPVNSVSWNIDGSSLVSGSSDKTVIVWNVSDKSILFTITGHIDAVLCVAWSANGMMIASSSDDTTIRVWDASDGGMICEYEGHASSVKAVAWSGNSEVIASASVDETVRLWDSVELSAKF
jgi:WD40 repeat protein